MARYQSFEEKANPGQGVERVALLREELRKRGLDGFLVPRADEHQSEYVAPHYERLSWLTGFTGSAGNALILIDQAILVIDGRYTIQAREQVSPSIFQTVELKDMTLETWISTHVPKGSIIAYDPWQYTFDGVKKLQAAAVKAEILLVASDTNLVDEIWVDRPSFFPNAIVTHSQNYAGENAETKVKRVREALKEARCSALLISDPHCLAWVFNIRGSDIPHTPLALGYGLIPQEGKSFMFFEGNSPCEDVSASLGSLVEFSPKDTLFEKIEELGSQNARIRFDESTAAYALIRKLESCGGIADIGPDPITLMKARKNAIELEGARCAHGWDGRAMIRFLAWLDEYADSGTVSEINAVEILEKFREESGPMKDVSFPTIAAVGPHAAMSHYRVTNNTSVNLTRNEIFLVDSGAQYECGTTDITRTIVVGNPSNSMIEQFTWVLKGMIALSRAIFPKGTSGAQLDALARQFLWQRGLDFDHGTGHGIGSYLSVHEGPQRIAKTGHTPLEAGMIVSNEPGFYKAGAYGIRIENLLVVEEKLISGADRDYYGFETLTYVPIDPRLINPYLMDEEEISWLNSYHSRVWDLYCGQLDGKEQQWLRKVTAPIQRT